MKQYAQGNVTDKENIVSCEAVFDKTVVTRDRLGEGDTRLKDFLAGFAALETEVPSFKVLSVEKPQAEIGRPLFYIKQKV